MTTLESRICLQIVLHPEVYIYKPSTCLFAEIDRHSTVIKISNTRKNGCLEGDLTSAKSGCVTRDV